MQMLKIQKTYKYPKFQACFYFCIKLQTYSETAHHVDQVLLSLFLSFSTWQSKSDIFLDKKPQTTNTWLGT